MYYSFDAYFSGKRVIIKGKEYKLCEILMCYLTAKTKDLQDTYYKCCRYVDILHYPENDIEQIQSRKFFQTAIDFYLSIEKLMKKFPPYEKLEGNVLSNILNCHQILFKDSKTEDDEDFYEFEEVKNLATLENLYFKQLVHSIKYAYNNDDEYMFNKLYYCSSSEEPEIFDETTKF